MPLPRQVLDSVRPCLAHGTAWTNQAIAFIHAGRSGSIAPLHFDWDHAWVAHACLSGRKRFFLLPPDAGWLLTPIVNLSALCLPRFSATDRQDLLGTLGGVEVMLEAGQGLLFPSMFWHGALYEEPSLSVSVRFEKDVGGRPFAALPRSWLLQRLIWRFFREGYGDRAQAFLSEYLREFFRVSRGWKARYHRMAGLCRQALAQYGEERGRQALVSDGFSTELALGSSYLKNCYGAACNSENVDQENLIETARYIFEGVDVQADDQHRLSSYALRIRQGLRPRRGLVDISTESGHSLKGTRREAEISQV
jgi:hypothetical protein